MDEDYEEPQHDSSPIGFDSWDDYDDYYDGYECQESIDDESQ